MEPPAAKRIVFFTGAGISAESGIPTFRGKGGIWDEYDWERVACQRAFDRDPVAVWDFHKYRRSLFEDARPSGGHRAIRRLEEHGVADVSVITQNIDGLHQQAGTEEVVELHGNVWRVRCTAPTCEHHREPWILPPKAETEGRCPCGAWLRPGIVWFEDPLDGAVLERAAELSRTADLFVSVGTSGVVWPAAALPYEAKKAGATLVEINPEATEASALHDRRLRVGATEGLETLAAELRSSEG